MATSSRLSDRFVRWARRILIAIIVVLAAAILLTAIEVMNWLDLGIVSKFSDLSSAGDILQFLGIGIAGAVLMLQALIADRRAKAMEDAAAAQAAAASAHATANLNTEEGQRQERLKNGIEHLGNDSESVRLGGAYELFHLAEDTASLRQTVLDILCAHIRRTTRENSYLEEHSSNPSQEIASLLTQLFVHGHEVFFGLRVNLSESRLDGADLRRARLVGADLRSAHLNSARLDGARLQRANLSGAYLHGARLEHSVLRQSSLVGTHLVGANLAYAELQGAIIFGCDLAGAIIRSGSLQGADLLGARMYGADLREASLEGARLSWARLQGATLTLANLRGAGDPAWESSASYAERIRASIGDESTLLTVQTGGLARDLVDKIVREVKLPSRRESLTNQLQPYIDAQDRYGLPEDHGAILGSYSQEEAAGWIAEHEAAMKAGAESGPQWPRT